VVLQGHNWGTPRDHEQARVDGSEYDEDWPESKRRRCATWWNLLTILRGAGISPDRCFFTNAYMGLKDDNDRNVGRLRTDPDFDRRCREFLGFQLRLLKPCIVISLGTGAREMMANLFDEPPDWRGPRSGLVQLRKGGIDLVAPPNEKKPFVHVAISHPCYPPNLSRGFAHEVSLLRRAIEMAPSSVPRYDAPA
jgi:hypothetical protein